MVMVGKVTINATFLARPLNSTTVYLYLVAKTWV